MKKRKREQYLKRFENNPYAAVVRDVQYIESADNFIYYPLGFLYPLNLVSTDTRIEIGLDDICKQSGIPISEVHPVFGVARVIFSCEFSGNNFDFENFGVDPILSTPLKVFFEIDGRDYGGGGGGITNIRSGQALSYDNKVDTDAQGATKDNLWSFRFSYHKFAPPYGTILKNGEKIVVTKPDLSGTANNFITAVWQGTIWVKRR